MKKKTTITISIVVALVILSKLLLQNKIDARQLVLTTAYIQAVDSSTEKPIPIKTKFPQPLLTDYLRTKSSVTAAHILCESSTKGLVKVTWIDLDKSNATIEIKAEGYQSYKVELEDLVKTKHSVSRGFIEPIIIKMNKK